MRHFTGDYIDALYYENSETRLQESTRLICGTDALVQAGTHEYYELARMRMQAKKEIMGLPRKSESNDTFASERDEHEQAQWSAVI